ncbi:MAG: IS66 family insertion sequence element accessory protein TnpA [Polyangiaceae bacterium]
MGGKARTTDGRRRWRQWTEAEAHAALAELAESGESLASFARGRGVGPNRLRYWRRRLGTALVPSFVQVRLPAATPRCESARIEIVVDDVTVRVREDIEVARLVTIVHALADRERAC